MIKVILAMIVVGILITVMALHWRDEKNSKFVPSVNVKNDNRVVDSLRGELKKTLDSFASYKPLIQQAIKKLQFYDSLYKHTQNTSSDTIWIKRMRSDLFEARLEIARLAEPRY